jgi:DNA-binding transcriptional LysR family regulator
MRLEVIEEFIVLAREQNFGRAANELNVSTSGLSRHIAELEREVGTPLLTRGKDGVLPTPAGSAYLDECQGSIRQLRRAEHVARRIATSEQSRLRIGHTNSTGSDIVVAAITAFSLDHPAVTIHLVEGSSAEHIEALVDRTLDIALLHPPVHHERIEEEEVRRETVGVVLPATHRLAGKNTADLADESFALIPHAADPGTNTRLLDVCRRAGFTPRTVHTATTNEAIIQLVAAGIGVGLLPLATAKHHRYNVRFKPLVNPVTLPIHLAWERHNSDPTVTEALNRIRAAAGRMR